MQRLMVIGAFSVALAACGGGGSSSSTPAAPPEATATFELTLTNLTNAQPLSPPLAVYHAGSYRVFALGEPATLGLETLAEAGDLDSLRDEAQDLDDVITISAFPDVIPPGATAQASVTVFESERVGLTLSVATMLVNTNDAFTAANRWTGLGELGVGESMMMRTIAYDAGTEADSEGPGTIPGPADGGEGFNATRDDQADRVSMHSGVVSNSDALATSVLSEQHRFDNPVAQLRVMRVN